jgi:hypothetical protein
MSTKFYDIVVAKEYQVQKDGVIETRTSWNKVGQGWPTKTPGSYNIELFHLPGTRYLLCLRDKPEQSAEINLGDMPF